MKLILTLTALLFAVISELPAAEKAQLIVPPEVFIHHTPERSFIGPGLLFAPGELAKAVADADRVVSCLPGGAETRGLLHRGIFSAMKPGASFHAVSRGSVIDFPALEEALRSGRLTFAGLDVCDREPLAQESPLWEMPNVLLTSHSAGWSPQLAGRLCELFAENLEDIRHDRPLWNVIPLR